MNTLHSADLADIIEMLADITDLHARIVRLDAAVAPLVRIADDQVTEIRRTLLRAALADVEVEAPAVNVAFRELVT